MAEKLRIALVEDDLVMLEQYKKYIESSEEMECMAAVSSAESFLKHIHSFEKLDVLLLDIELPGISGLEAIPKIKAKLPNVHLVMMTTFSDEETVFKALRLGADGYLLKRMTRYEFLKTILSVREDGTPLSPEIARKIVSYFNPSLSLFSFSNNKEKLTKKEKIVLSNLVQGLSYNEIGEILDISLNGVRFHVRNIYKKLQVDSRAKLTSKYKELDIDQF
ncbi:MAG: response regulator transcription factor [Saprospiraceae bacterium]|nr:response regulator transcription factor [Saprospiraceae bacterium]